MTALAVEALDELADGTKAGAFPLIRGDLHLTYDQIGLLISAPLLIGGLLELPFGLVAGSGSRRHRLVLAGGVLLAGSLAAVASASGFWFLLAALIAFFPASGAFVGLTQAALMDADPGRQQERMAAWNLAGSAGAVAGPSLVAVVLSAGGTWRAAYVLVAGAAVVTVAVTAVAGPASLAGGTAKAEANTASQEDMESERPSLKAALKAIRRGDVARWLILLQVIDLLLDVFTGYLGVYLVDVARVSPALAAVGVAISLGAGLAGDALFVLVSGRVSGQAALRASACVAAICYPAFLLVPALGVKFVLLGLLNIATACWYPVIQAGLYGSLPGQSGIAVFWSSAAGIAGSAGPFLVGVLAQQAGLGPAMWCLTLAPAAVLMLGKIKRSIDD
ncbi:MAG TPA: MFS transporter [Streptosporangiaceae bacterium]|nr:MFS transporter [Streptosporangiaceae bacterium]